MKNIIYLIAALLCIQACSNKENSLQESLPLLLSESSNQASCVFLTTDEKDRVVVSWVELDSSGNKQFLFASWDVQTKRFGSPKQIPIAENAAIHEEGMPKIAFKADGTLVAIYETNTPLEGSRFGLSDLLYLTSADRGETWSQAKSVRQAGDRTSPGSVSFANILRLDDGELGISWLGTNAENSHEGRPVQFVRSNSGNTFSQPVTLDPNACQCCRTAISTNGQGVVSVLYRDILPGSIRDISVASSTDNGQTFQEPAPFSNDQWVLDGCPHNGPSVASTAGSTYVAWYTGSGQNGVFYAELNENNEMLNKQHLDADGRFVQLCLMDNGTRMVAFSKNYRQNNQYYTKIMINKITSKGTFEKEVSTGTSHASYPVVQNLDKQSVIVAWSDDGKIYYRLLHADQVDTEKQEAHAGIPGTGGSATVKVSNTKDPVCGMQLPGAVERRNSLRHQNRTIGFCGEACKKQFNPLHHG